MVEDTSLKLKIDYEKGINISTNEAQKLLEQSEIINRLLTS